MNRPLTFQTVEFKVIDHKGHTWLTMRDITAALYSGTEGGDTSVTPLAERAMRRVFARHAHEFTTDMTTLVKLQTAKGLQKARIFSLRGAYLLGMLARTPKAEAFRRWVLDVLEGVTRARVHSQGMNQRRKEKPRLLKRIEALRELALPLEGGAV